MKQKIYTSAPLPFQGQKRRFVKEFGDILLNSHPKIIVDLFGGSGLLSHTAKRTLPDSAVIYNDYDNYRLRLLNVDNTNRILADLRDILSGYPSENRIIGKEHGLIMRRLRREKGFVDWITVSSSLLFSMKYALNFKELSAQTLYNNMKHTDYRADGYLDGLQAVRFDYYDLFLQYKDIPGVLFVVDPPYLSTDSKTYNSDGYWKLRDYLNVLRVLDNVDYVFFTSNKSSMIELLEWLEEIHHITSPFKTATVRTATVQLNYNSRYTDMMLCSIKKEPQQIPVSA